jgi:hypothetical protein
MKIATLIARNLLGLLFLVMGLNGFLHFIPMPPPTGLAGQYFTVMFVSHYMVLVFLLQVIAGTDPSEHSLVPFANGAGGSAAGFVGDSALGHRILRSAPGICGRVHAAGED